MRSLEQRGRWYKIWQLIAPCPMKEAGSFIWSVVGKSRGQMFFVIYQESVCDSLVHLQLHHRLGGGNQFRFLITIVFFFFNLLTHSTKLGPFVPEKVTHSQIATTFRWRPRETICLLLKEEPENNDAINELNLGARTEKENCQNSCLLVLLQNHKAEEKNSSKPINKFPTSFIANYF